jgi:6-phosphogluconate dehydrogenase
MSSKSVIGVIGLSVMGGNLARNFASRNMLTSVYNRSHEKTQEIIEHHGHNMQGFDTLSEFVESLETPRKIFIMVKSGEPVDELIETLKPLIDSDDILVDCGNSNWQDTERRQEQSHGKYHFVGCGVSGGSHGALYGPSIMPGGESETVEKLLAVLRPIAGKDFLGFPCVSNVGIGASGHFVKMVHNGIEYGLMQGIAEIYGILRGMGMNHEQMRKVFGMLNHGNLQSFLLDITEDILETKNETGDFLLTLVDQRAGSKGTGGWTVEAGIQFGVNVQTLSAALFARYASSEIRYPHDISKPKEYEDDEISEDFVQLLHSTLEMVYFACYIQGINLVRNASKVHSWSVDLDEVLRIWEGGCIIRSQMISTLRTYLSFNETGRIDYLYLHADRLSEISRKLTFYRESKPVIHSSFDYISTLISHDLPSNLIQAQRDYFGEHGYKRSDSEGEFTGGWSKN